MLLQVREGFLEEVMPEVTWPGRERWEVFSKKTQSEAWNHIVKERELRWFGFTDVKSFK